MSKFGNTGGKHGPSKKAIGPAFCSKCKKHSLVVDTRHLKDYVRRRRACPDKTCPGKRWATVEIPRKEYKEVTKIIEQLRLHKQSRKALEDIGLL